MVVSLLEKLYLYRIIICDDQLHESFLSSIVSKLGGNRF